MDAGRRGLLAIYLNDHLAGATAGVGRARMVRQANEGTEFASRLAEICREVEEDRATLVSIMDDFGVGRSRIKPALGDLGERIGRLKPNGRLRGHSPLGRVIDLEVLLLGITGKLRLWRLLGELLDGETKPDLPGLITRAEAQRSKVEELQVRAAGLL